ncbi:hypothetical protein L3Q82_016605, partial [Scortum barcoo]
EDRSKSPSEVSKDLSNEPGPSDTRAQSSRQRSESPGSSCLSLKSDRSKGLPPDFSIEAGPSDTKKCVDRERKRSHVSVEEQPSCCASCQDVLKVPVSTSCGHWFCRQCISLILGPVCFIRKLLLSPVWKKIQNKSWTADSQSDQQCTKVTEVRGFTDAQKEEYFRRRVSDEDLSSRIISHIKTSRTLHIMCQIPVFCWITATVLDHMLTTDQRGELPKTLTDLYSHFLLVQTKRKKQKYDEGHETSPQELMEADREVLLKLGRLAFEHLEKGNIMFYQEDLEQCGLDVTEASVYSGVCTEIFKRECVIFQKTVYCFVHLSIQEFLAAIYMFHCYTNRNTEVLDAFLGKRWGDENCDLPLDVFLSRAMQKSLESEKWPSGPVCSLPSWLLSGRPTRRLLGGLLGQIEKSPEIIQRAIDNLKKKTNITPARSINVFHCLTEMNDHSVHQEIQEFLKSENRSEEETL